MAGEPRHSVDKRLMMVDTEAAVALGSGMFADALVEDDAFPGVPCVPIATAGPAAFDKRFNNSVTNPKTKKKKQKFNNSQHSSHQSKHTMLSQRIGIHAPSGKSVGY